jgi:hypothetical protein
MPGHTAPWLHAPPARHILGGRCSATSAAPAEAGPIIHSMPAARS